MVQMFSREALTAALDAQSIGWRGLGVVGLVLVAAGEKRKLQGLGAILAVFSIADAGHALSVLPKGFGHGLMLVHGLAAAMWMGAIAPLRHALLRDAGPATLGLFRRFQTYGGLAMGATLASGLVLTWLLLPHLSDLWQSSYGLRLSAKLAAVGIMMLIAGGNRLVLTRRALAGRERMRRLLGIILGFDVVAAAMATVLAVGLSLGPPPSRALEVAVADASYDGTLSFAPGKAGDNDLLIALAPKAGASVEPQEIEVRLTVAGLGPITRKATRVGLGRYAVHQLPLWVPGRWNVELHVLVDDFTSLELSAPVTMRK
jgi:copper transport protein